MDKKIIFGFLTLILLSAGNLFAGDTKTFTGSDSDFTFQYSKEWKIVKDIAPEISVRIMSDTKRAFFDVITAELSDFSSADPSDIAEEIMATLEMTQTSESMEPISSEVMNSKQVDDGITVKAMLDIEDFGSWDVVINVFIKDTKAYVAFQYICTSVMYNPKPEMKRLEAMEDSFRIIYNEAEEEE